MNNVTDRIRLFPPGLLAEELAKAPPMPTLRSLLAAELDEVERAERRRRALDAVRKPARGPLWYRFTPEEMSNGR